jgi:hypothetical protein
MSGQTNPCTGSGMEYFILKQLAILALFARSGL